jgi:hypothetical protein
MREGRTVLSPCHRLTSSKATGSCADSNLEMQSYFNFSYVMVLANCKKMHNRVTNEILALEESKMDWKSEPMSHNLRSMSLVTALYYEKFVSYLPFERSLFLWHWN